MIKTDNDIQCFLTYNSLIDVYSFKIESLTDDNRMSSFDKLYATRKSFSINTNLIANFLGYEDLLASYIDYKTETQRGNFSIYRKKFGETYYQYIASIRDGKYEMMDYNVESKSFYHYMATVEKQVEVTPGSGEFVTKYFNYESNFMDPRELKKRKPFFFLPLFYNWVICDIQLTDEDNIYTKIGNTWNIGLGVTFDSVTQNTGVIQNETLGRFGKIVNTTKNYDSGSFSGLLGEIQEYTKYTFNNEEKDSDNSYYSTKRVYEYTEKIPTYNQTYKDVPYYEQESGWKILNPYAREMDKLDSWKKFVFNGNLKLLRSPKGENWVISILALPSSSINYQAVDLHTTISFQWQEVLSSDEISIYGQDTD